VGGRGGSWAEVVGRTGGGAGAGGALGAQEEELGGQGVGRAGGGDAGRRRNRFFFCLCLGLVF
jgi:hypothetical protein